MSFVDRFWAKVAKGDGCWEWTAALRNGYGVISRDGALAYAHRVSWELAFGAVPEGMCICHRCDNRRCVRPDHFFLGTKDDNNRDARQKGRMRKPTPRLGERHPNAVLTNELVLRIRKERADGGTLGGIAARLGLKKSLVAAVASRRAWGHVS